MAHAPTVLDPEHKWCAPPGATAAEEERIEAELQEQADALIEKEVKRAYELYGDKATVSRQCSALLLSVLETAGQRSVK